MAGDKMRSGAGQICETDLNGDNLRISRISDHRRVTVRVRVADCSIQTADESDKMRINHASKTDQWRAAPQTSGST